MKLQIRLFTINNDFKSSRQIEIDESELHELIESNYLDEYTELESFYVENIIN